MGISQMWNPLSPGTSCVWGSLVCGIPCVWGFLAFSDPACVGITFVSGSFVCCDILCVDNVSV